jgi:hypothetical protein
MKFDLRAFPLAGRFYYPRQHSALNCLQLQNRPNQSHLACEATRSRNAQKVNMWLQ